MKLLFPLNTTIMSCNSHGEFRPCGMDDLGSIDITKASDVVSIDLSNPIDISKMRVDFASVDTIEQERGERLFMRTVQLSTSVINDGENEELTITFELKSLKRPKTL